MITVCIKVKGYLKNYFKEGSYNIDLKTEATLKDLFEKIDEIFGQDIPSSIWAREKKQFRGPIAISISGESITDMDYKLTNGDEITLSRIIVGG